MRYRSIVTGILAAALCLSFTAGCSSGTAQNKEESKPSAKAEESSRNDEESTATDKTEESREEKENDGIGFEGF